jgi:hypothetical protein
MTLRNDAASPTPPRQAAAQPHTRDSTQTDSLNASVTITAHAATRAGGNNAMQRVIVDAVLMVSAVGMLTFGLAWALLKLTGR